jgi:long-chain fatty acid transport protein
VLLLTVLSSPLAQAAGFYTTTSGAKALGRGGAYTAGVDDLSAQFHNPAGLVRIDEPQIMLDISWVEATASFHRAPFVPDDPKLDTVEFDEVDEEGAPFPIPSIAFGTHFGLEDWTFAIGFYPHYAPHQVWPEDGAQRYSLVESVEWQAYAGPSAAHRFNDWLTIGLGLQWTFLRADRDFALSSCIAETCEDNPTYDIESSVKSLDPFTPSANAGVLIEPSDRLSMGLLFQLPISYSAKAKVTTRIPDENPLQTLVGGQNEFTDDDATLLVDFPLILKAGADLAVSDRVHLELDAGYQGWSRTQEIRLTDLNITIPIPESKVIEGGETVVDDDVVIAANYVGSYSVHLGSEWATSEKLDLRAGAFFETSAVPEEWFNVTELDGNKIGGGIGASWRPSKRVAIDVALARNELLVSEVNDSQSSKVVLNIVPKPPDYPATVEDGEPVANGTYDIAITIGSLGATYFF